MEYFDVVDENGMPTGEIVERKEAHRCGIAHRTAHVWIVRRVNGRVQILLQKRCQNKDSFPGCYDISSAGHIPAGMEFRASAIRELKEELNVEISEDQLIECGDRFLQFDTEFYGEEFHDRQFSRVFLLWLDWEEQDFTVQKEEIESVRWMDFEQCKKAVRENTIPNCILVEELEMISAYF